MINIRLPAQKDGCFFIKALFQSINPKLPGFYNPISPWLKGEVQVTAAKSEF